MDRITRKKNSNYSVISNVFVRDKNLSLKAKGLLTLIMSLPDSWDFSVSGISAISKEGRSAIYSTIKELKENGYCVASSERDAAGRVLGWNYTFHETPTRNEAKPLSDYPLSDYPLSENQEVENRTQINKERINKDLNNYLLNKENSVKESFEASLSTPIAGHSENENIGSSDPDELFEALNRVLDQPTTLKDPKTEKEKSSAKKEKENKAIPASVEEVAAYCREKGFTISAEAFFNYHSASGWMIGKNKMKDWKAAVRYWAANESKTKKKNYYDRREIGGETPVIATCGDDYRQPFVRR